MKDLLIYGAGGYGREIYCLIESINRIGKKWNFLGFIDDGLSPGCKKEYGTVLGGLSYLQEYSRHADLVLAIGNSEIRKNIVRNLLNQNISFPNIIAPEILFLDVRNATLGIGNIIGTKCSISCNVHIGDFNLFNSNINIGHDTIIGSYNSFMTGTVIAGDVSIGNYNSFGLTSAVLQGIKIGDCVRVSPGSVILRNTKDNNLYVGNPAVKMKF